MNLRQLETFVRVAETGSFSKAADSLYLTQPTVSAHISALEKDLNVRLFLRNTKEINLTGDGKKLYKYAKQIVRIEGEIKEEFGMTEEKKPSRVAIAASTIPAQYLLPKILYDFREHYPDEKIKILETNSAAVNSLVAGHEVDIGFIGTVSDMSHCRYIPFYRDELVIITPNTEKYRALQEAGDEDISWVQDEHWIMRESGSGTQKEAEKMLNAMGVRVDDLDVMESTVNQETIKKNVSRGMGIAVLSRLAVEDDAKDGKLLMFTFPGENRFRDICVVYNGDYGQDRSVKRLIGTVKRLFGVEADE